MFTECEILQNLEYPVACLDLNLSDSKKFLVSVGTYQPSVKVYDLHNLSEKSTRHLESDPIKVVGLTKNADKLAILRVDRYVELHASYGMHERIRVPFMSYDLKFNKYRSELLCCGQSNDVYRFDLENGCCMNSYATSLQSIYCMDINKVHGLVGCVGTGIEFIDSRVQKTVSLTTSDTKFTALSFSENGINFSVGTECGIVTIYDLRSETPLYVHEHVGHKEIHKVKMDGKKVISADTSAIYIYTEHGEETIDCNKKINTFEQEGGVIIVGLDDMKVKTFYSIDFGTIPMWYSAIVRDK